MYMRKLLVRVDNVTLVLAPLTPRASRPFPYPDAEIAETDAVAAVTACGRRCTVRSSAGLRRCKIGYTVGRENAAPCVERRSQGDARNVGQPGGILHP